MREGDLLLGELQPDGERKSGRERNTGRSPNFNMSSAIRLLISGMVTGYSGLRAMIERRGTKAGAGVCSFRSGHTVLMEGSRHGKAPAAVNDIAGGDTGAGETRSLEERLAVEPVLVGRGGSSPSSWLIMCVSISFLLVKVALQMVHLYTRHPKC